MPRSNFFCKTVIGIGAMGHAGKALHILVISSSERRPIIAKFLHPVYLIIAPCHQG
jgi:hypothetical protein